MDTKTRLIQQLDQSRQKMRAAQAAMKASAEIYPAWTIKELLAHITGWDDAIIASLCAHAEGREPAMPASRGVDAYNAETVSTRRAFPFQFTC